MAQRNPINQDPSLDHKPPYLGKTIAVVQYCMAAGFGLAAVALAWLAIRAYYRGSSTGFATTHDQAVFLGAMSAYCLLFAIAFFLLPTLQSQFPKLRHENRFSLQSMEAQRKRSARYGRKHRKIVVRHAPKPLQRTIRFCYWAPYFILACLIFSAAINRTALSPKWMNRIVSNINSTLPATFGIGFFFLGIIFAFHLPLLFLERRARHLYDRHLRRLERGHFSIQP